MSAVRWLVLGFSCLSFACAVHKDGPPDGGGAGAMGGSSGVGGDGGIGGTSGSGGTGASGGSGGSGGVGGSGGTGGVGGSSGSGGDGGGEPLCEIDRDKRKPVSRNVSKVHFGTLEPSHLGIAPEQVLAIGKIDLEDNSVAALCTGALITPRWVLTAKHCTEGFNASDVTFSIGYMPDGPNQAFSVTSIVEHNSADIALLELSEPATDRVPELIPIRLFTGTLDGTWLNRVVEAAGYGETEDQTTGTRYFTAEPIHSLTGDEVWVDGQGQRGLCGGDSGGPLMTQVADGSIRVIGELHGGDASCVGVDRYTRVDVLRVWIEQHVGPTPAFDELSCSQLGSEGRCVAGTAAYCSNNVIQRDTCENGNVCGWSAAASGFRCVLTGSDPCDGFDARGECDGDVATACVDGVLERADCAACGLMCSEDGADGANCVEIPTDPCATLDFIGRCDGNVVEWCVDGDFRQLDCTTRNQSCGWRGDQIGYYCGL